ncbi:DNA double-strand break repair nuclease NurA [Thermoleophilum album]|uniref:DNA double-strand break repair nuclease NurA n=1 Tax=Thermoleophilum album TaxID=29539 RepID=UPI00237D2623|nr:DNA double-strand break repair nuclease NurA [Thermoleophilum album]WDT93019.1 DNA double-strand break repair nuclease NurA [Thermoleophilum album]
MTAGGELPDQIPFADLPAALVEEVLHKTATIAADLLASFREIREERSALRKKLEKSGLLIEESSLGYPPPPTTCATDGSYAIDRLLTIDLAAAAAVAVEGLTPPSEKRHWERPHHKTFIAAEPHLEDTASVLRAVMLGEELRLATSAPHDVVMIDGTLTLPIIYFNQALNKVPDAKGLRCSMEFLENGVEYLSAYLELLRSERSDKQYIALSKYSTRREIGKRLGWLVNHDDRGMLTLLLKSGELTEPVELEHPRDSEGRVTWHLNTGPLRNESNKQANELAKEILSALQSVTVFYYKPHDWLPALRVEVAASVASNTHRLATVVQGLKHQCATASMLEPYPIYLADRTAKALARAIPAFRQVTTQRVSERYSGEVGEVFFALHGYRSESGR